VTASDHHQRDKGGTTPHDLFPRARTLSPDITLTGGSMVNAQAWRGPF
jgi:hypothetical protein